MGAESELAARSVCDSSLCKPVSEMAENRVSRLCAYFFLGFYYRT